MTHTLTCILPRKTMQTHLTNGHVGLQASDSGVAPARSFMVGISDLTPTDVYRMAGLPTWNAVAITVDGDTLEDAFARGDVRDYVQTLDMAAACLTTRYAARLGGAWVSVTVETWLSRADRFVGYQSVRLAADVPVTATAEIGITQNPEPTRYPWRTLQWPHEDYPRQYGHGFKDARMTYAWHPGHMAVTRVLSDALDGVWAVSAAAAGHGPAVGVALALRAPGAAVAPRSDASNSRAVLTLDLGPHDAREIELFVAFARDDRPSTLADTAARRALAAREAGRDALWAPHAAAWAELWQGDLIVEGDDLFAAQARADLFYLYQNCPVDDRYPIQIMGIASPGYFGGCFWDTDVHNLPAVLPFRNRLAESTIRFRQRILPFAMQNAAREGYRGAKYAWISELAEGEENCAGHSFLAREQVHINADVALAVWLHFCATGDTIFLRNVGWPILEGVADFFASRATWVPWEGRYELLHVCSAAEHLGAVQNCLYTNAATRKALRSVCRAAEVLGLGVDPAWRAVADGLHLPFNAKTGLYQANSATENPDPDRWLMTNAILLGDLPATPAQLADTISAAPIGWDMSYQATIAAQAGDAARMRDYLHFQATHFVHPEFRLRTEMIDNDAGPYLTGSACFVQNLLLGAGGLRWTEAGLTPRFPACLPDGVTRLTFPRLEWHERAYAVTIDRAHGTVIEPLLERTVSHA